MAFLTLKFVTDVRDNDYEVVEFHGELDKSTLDSAEEQLLKLLDSFDRGYLVFDFSDLDFINSEGIGVIVLAHAKLVTKGKQLLVCGMHKHVAEVIDAVGIGKLVPVFPKVADAINFMKKN